MSESERSEMETHPYAEVFPMMGEVQIKELSEDIEANGQIEPIVRYEGKILDGRGRFVACARAGIKPAFVDWSGPGSPVQYVWSKNYTRRHLSSSQKAVAIQVFSEMLAKEAKGRMSRGAKLSIVKGVANLPHPIDGESPDGESVAPVSDDERGRTREKLAEMAGVSPRLIQDAIRVQEQSPELIDKIKRGDVTVHGALKTIKDGKAGGTAGKPAVSDDPVTKFLSATKLAVKAAESVCKSPPEGGFPNGLAEAINSLGFAYSQLLPVLARSGDSDAMEMARRTIAQLAAMKLGTGP